MKWDDDFEFFSVCCCLRNTHDIMCVYKKYHDKGILMDFCAYLHLNFSRVVDDQQSRKVRPDKTTHMHHHRHLNLSCRDVRCSAFYLQTGASYYSVG